MDFRGERVLAASLLLCIQLVPRGAPSSKEESHQNPDAMKAINIRVIPIFDADANIISFNLQNNSMK